MAKPRIKDEDRIPGVSPWDFTKSISQTKENLLEKGYQAKDYNAFLVNKWLSYFPESDVRLANLMNRYHHLDPDMQYIFYLATVSLKKRFKPWHKKEKNDLLDLVMEYFGYSRAKALDALDVLSDEDIRDIRERMKMRKGGRR